MAGTSGDMEIALTMGMPRETASIPLVRHIVRAAMAEAGVERGCASDIQVALSEACSNAVDHSGGSSEYRVRFEVRGCVATIEVEDGGSGFDPDGDRSTDPLRERGRGMLLMRALVDLLVVGSGPGCGTVVVMRKRLDFEDESPFSHVLESIRQHDGAISAAAARSNGHGHGHSNGHGRADPDGPADRASDPRGRSRNRAGRPSAGSSNERPVADDDRPPRHEGGRTYSTLTSSGANNRS